MTNKIKSQLFGILNFGHCDLPFDLAQGGGELVEPFDITETQHLKSQVVTYNILSEKTR
jgi:hypothetical protein